MYLKFSLDFKYIEKILADSTILPASIFILIHIN